MKTHFTCVENKVGYYVWRLARNLLHAKRNLKSSRESPDYPHRMFLQGVENEANNRFKSAKEFFEKEIRKIK